MNILKAIMSGPVLFFITPHLFAQQNELDPVTISASVNPLNVSATGRNMIVLQGDQISKMPVNSLDELLRYMPGIEVQSRGPMGSQSDIVLRGGTFQQILIIIDGIRINDPNTGHFNSYIPIAPAEIERIEVLKGASSAIYGTEAVGGVINIITKTFSAKAGKNKKQLTARAGGGESGLANGQMGGFLQKENYAGAIAATSNNSNGQPQRGTNGYFHNHTASASFNCFLNKNWKIAARSSFDKRDFAAQNFYTTFKSDTASEKVTSYQNQLRLSYERDKHNFTISAGYKNVNDEYLYNKSSIANFSKSRLIQALAVYNVQYSRQTALIAGTQYLSKKIISNDRGDHQLTQAGVFIQLNQSAGKALRFSPAIRAEYSERSGWEGVPQINVSYKLPYAQLRMSAGKTIRDADFTERYNNYNKPIVTSGRIGNPDLKQERSYSYEAGADYFGIKGIKLSGTFFIKQYSRLIDYVNTLYADMPRKDNLSPNGTYALAENISKVVSTGVEADMQYTRQFSEKKQLYATFGMSCIDSRSDNARPSFYVSSHANFLTNFSIQYAVRSFSISINGLYKERMPSAVPAIMADVSKDYFVMNAMMQLFIYKKSLSIYSQLDNVLNRNYSDITGSQMPGRWWMGGLKMDL